jgi:hypothetical protein
MSRPQIRGIIEKIRGIAGTGRDLPDMIGDCMMQRTILSMVVPPVSIGLRSAVAAREITDATAARVPDRILAEAPSGRSGC